MDLPELKEIYQEELEHSDIYKTLMVSLDLASAFKFQKINNPMLKSYRLTSQKSRKMSLLPSTEIKGRKKEPSSRNTSMANLKISLPISKIKVSKKKNKKSFLSFITTLVRAQKAFSYLFKIERVSRRLSA